MEYQRIKAKLNTSDLTPHDYDINKKYSVVLMQDVDEDYEGYCNPDVIPDGFKNGGIYVADVKDEIKDIDINEIIKGYVMFLGKGAGDERFTNEEIVKKVVNKNNQDNLFHFSYDGDFGIMICIVQVPLWELEKFSIAQGNDSKDLRKVPKKKFVFRGNLEEVVDFLV
jgi:hypothetical protein